MGFFRNYFLQKNLSWHQVQVNATEMIYACYFFKKNIET